MGKRRSQINVSKHKDDKAPRDYVSRIEGESGFANIEDCVDAWIQGLKEYIKKSKERLITAESNSNIEQTEKQQKLGNGNGKKNNCMNIFSYKLMKSHTRRPGYN